MSDIEHFGDPRQPKDEDTVSSTTRSVNMRTLPLILLAACGPFRVMSPEVESLGASLGDASAALVSLEAEPSDAALREAVVHTGDELVALVLAWDAGRDSEEPHDLASLSVDDLASWNGETLNASFAEGTSTYAVALRRRTGVVRSDIAGTPAAEAAVWGSGEVAGESVFLPPFIERTFDLQRRVGDTDVRLRADYVQLTLDGDGCTAGGGVEISYELTAAEVTRAGWVRTGFHGCGRVHVYER